MAASPDESSAVVAGILTFGILWLDWAREHNDKRAVEGLPVFVPEGRSRFIRERALGLAPTVRLEIFEFNEREGTVRKMDAADVGNLQSRLVARMGAESALAGAQDVMNCVRSLAADSGPRNGIAARVVAGTKEVAFCFRGLEVARAGGRKESRSGRTIPSNGSRSGLGLDSQS
jgi:hypothetical protein